MINEKEFREAIEEVKKVTEGVFAHNSSYMKALELLIQTSQAYLDEQKEIVNLMLEIQKEIERRPKYTNLGKIFCLKRLQEIYNNFGTKVREGK